MCTEEYECIKMNIELFGEHKQGLDNRRSWSSSTIGLLNGRHFDTAANTRA